MSTFPTEPVQRILAETNLTQREKIEQLRQLDYDIREMSVAAEEGMTGTSEPGRDLAAVQRALRSLGADVAAGGASKH